MYRLSDHSLAIETGRHKKTWLPKEKRLCVHCNLAQVETEAHFLLSCPKYLSIRNQYFPKFTVQNIQFEQQLEPNQPVWTKLFRGNSDVHLCSLCVLIFAYIYIYIYVIFFFFFLLHCVCIGGGGGGCCYYMLLF